MKVLIISALDNYGAGRAAYRLHRALISAGAGSVMLVQDKLNDDYTVIGPETNIKKGIAIARPVLDQIPVKFYGNRSRSYFSPAYLPFSGVLKKIKGFNPDIVHLHWICKGMLSIEDIAKIRQPVVWSLHDMWPFTGGCHYDGGCGKYKPGAGEAGEAGGKGTRKRKENEGSKAGEAETGKEGKCGKCPVLGSNKENDLSRRIYNRKEKAFSKLPGMAVVGLSRWLEDCAKESSLFKDNFIVNLPNPIDTDLYKPFDKAAARKLWNLPQDKKLVLFGATNVLNDERKGYDKFIQAASKISSKNTELVVFGGGEPEHPPKLGLKTRYMGKLIDDISLITLYSACDVTVVPSLQENLSNMIMESLSIGTPAIAFDTGGNVDMIEHKVNGYLAKPFDAGDLAAGIDWVVNAENYAEMSKNAREKVLKEFEAGVVAEQYIKLYDYIINRKNSNNNGIDKLSKYFMAKMNQPEIQKRMPF